MKTIHMSEGASIESATATAEEYKAYRNAIAQELASNPISDDFRDYLVLMTLAHAIEYKMLSNRGASAQELALPVLRGLEELIKKRLSATN